MSKSFNGNVFWLLNLIAVTYIFFYSIFLALVTIYCFHMAYKIGFDL